MDKNLLKDYSNKEINLDKNTIKTITLDGQVEKVEKQLIAFQQTPEKVKKSFLRVIAKNPELKKVQPTSALLAIAQTMELGLDLDPMEGEVALIPYKQGLSNSVAQLQIMWKGYRKILLSEGVGIKGFSTYKVCENDIIKWDPSNGEMIWNKSLWSTDFKDILEKKGMKPIGYMATILLDEKLYKQKNFSYFMTNEEIEEWKKEYGSRTKINFDTYARKTLAKRVIREYKHLIMWGKDQKEKINIALEKDQSANDGNKTIYVENGENK